MATRKATETKVGLCCTLEVERLCITADTLRVWKGENVVALTRQTVSWLSVSIWTIPVAVLATYVIADCALFYGTPETDIDAIWALTHPVWAKLRLIILLKATVAQQPGWFFRRLIIVVCQINQIRTEFLKSI